MVFWGYFMPNVSPLSLRWGNKLKEMITTTTVWNHRGRVSKNGEGPLEVRVTIDRKPYYIATGLRCTLREWKYGVVVNRSDADVINDRLKVISKNIQDEITRCIEMKQTVDVVNIRRIANGLSRLSPTKSDLIDWIEEQIPILDVSPGTRKHYKTLVYRLREFGIIRCWDDLSVENIYKWDAWLHSIPKELSKSRKARGEKADVIGCACVFNYHKRLKSMLNRAVKFGRIHRNPYDRLKGEFRRGDKQSVEYLTEDEIQVIMSVKPVGSMEALAKDLFIFQMWTGLSYADMMSFDASDYKKINGKWRNTGERVKTGVPYVSQLLPPAVEVLEKYSWTIPKISNQKYNKAMKSLADRAGIRTRLHSHLARHTFATMMLKNGARIENVSAMLGHTNIKQTQRYAKVLAESVHEEFDKVWELIQQKSEVKK